MSERKPFLLSREFLKRIPLDDEPGGLMACSPEIWREMKEANARAMREAKEARARKATALYLDYLEYKAAILRQRYPLPPAPYEHFLAMLDYYPDPTK